MNKPLTIAFQPFATSWLGHTSRLIAIAQGIRRRKADARLVFIVEGTSGLLLEAAGFPHISLPAETAWAGPEWKDWPAEERDRMLGEVAKTVLEQIQPRLIVFDSRPCTYVAQQTERMRIPTAFVARRTRNASRCFEWAQAHRSFVDLIVVPHEPGEVPVPADLVDRTHFVGTIVRDRPLDSKESPAPRGKRVLITGGGGGFPGTVDYYNQALDAACAVRSGLPSLDVMLITGPMFREWEKLRSVEGVTIVPFEPDLGRTMARADVIICQAGYNTVAETEGLGIPTICMPAPRVADDQFARARAVAEQRKEFFVLTDCTTETLRDQIIQCLAMPRGPMIRSSAPEAPIGRRSLFCHCAHDRQRQLQSRPGLGEADGTNRVSVGAGAGHQDIASG